MIPYNFLVSQRLFNIYKFCQNLTDVYLINVSSYEMDRFGLLELVSCKKEGHYLRPTQRDLLRFSGSNNYYSKGIFLLSTLSALWDALNKMPLFLRSFFGSYKLYKSAQFSFPSPVHSPLSYTWGNWVKNSRSCALTRNLLLITYLDLCDHVWLLLIQ